MIVALGLFLNAFACWRVSSSPQTSVAQEQEYSAGKIETDKTRSESLVKLGNWLIPTTSFLNSVFSLFLFLANLGLVVIVCLQLKTTRETERAYVRLSHKKIRISMPKLEQMTENATVKIEIVVDVMNKGRTPADVHKIFLDKLVFESNKPWPDRLVFNSENTPHAGAFLVANDNCYETFEFSITYAEYRAIQNKEKKFLLFGYVDYSDKFGKRHVGGYARECTPIDGDDGYPTMHTEFVSLPDYNYDRRICVG